MKKKVLSLLLVFAMMFSCVPAQAANSHDENSEATVFSGSIAERTGSEVTSVTEETDDQYITKIYVDNVLQQRAVANKNSTLTILEMYDENGNLESRDEYNLSENVSDVDFANRPAQAAELIPTDDFDIYKRYRTDYLYQGAIMYGDTYTMAHELSESYRYEGHMLEFGAGTAAGLIVSALLLYFGGEITVAALRDLGISTSAGVLVDYLCSEVCFTKYRVVTKVYFDDIYTVNAGNTYDKVIVRAGAGGNDHYTTGYYGYDIVSSWASYCCSSGAVAFQDKYVMQNNPNLRLPLTSIPYNG